MVKEAREWVRSGKLGKLMKVVVEYPQGYAITALEAGTISKIANWRMDPNVSGVSNCMGDIGTHAHNLARYITGLEVEEICAELSTFIPGRLLDDDGNCLVRFTDGVKGLLFASQIRAARKTTSTFASSAPRARCSGSRKIPTNSSSRKPTRPQQIHRRGNGYLSPVGARRHAHALRPPEGFHRGIREHLSRRAPWPSPIRFPAASRRRAAMISPRSTTASPAWPSSKPP
jgi:predicted dehydrogenase